MKKLKQFLVLMLLTLLAVSMGGCENYNTEDLNPDILYFRGQVLEFDPAFYLRNEDAALFVYSITPVGEHNSGGKYFINKNDAVVILNVQGETISHTDIPPGTIVDIKYYGFVHQSLPAVIPGAVSIQIVDE